MDKRSNVVWIVVDSVRSYVSGQDDRDKLDIMFKMGCECVEFTTVVTSAPSSLMSASAMLTSVPAYYIGRNYEDFKYDNSVFTSLQDMLKPEGYCAYGVISGPHTRTRLQTAMDMVGSAYYPSDFPNRNGLWTNREVNGVLFNLLDVGIEEPALILVWYNVRKDPHTSALVESGIDRLRDAGVLNEDSIFILTSDHGYPDPRRGITPESLKAQGLTHDLVMTDDNILVPLYIKYPGSPVKTIEHPVSSLDIMPTILDLLNIRYPQGRLVGMSGSSLLPTIQGSSLHERPVWLRSDSRFLLQEGRTTAVRGNRHKYIYHHDTMQEEFYDLEADPHEDNNLAKTRDGDAADVLETFRQRFQEMETDAAAFQIHYMLERFLGTPGHSTLGDGGSGAFLIVGFGAPLFWEVVGRGLRRQFPQGRFDLLVAEGDPAPGLERHYDRIESLRANRDSPLIAGGTAPDGKAYDAIIVTRPAARTPGYRTVINTLRRRSRARVWEIDCNMDIYRFGRQKRRWGKILRTRVRTYRKTPSLFFCDVRAAARLLRRAVSKRLRV